MLVRFSSAEFSEASVKLDRNIAKLTVVGEGMKAHAGIAAQMFEVWDAKGLTWT